MLIVVISLDPENYLSLCSPNLRKIKIVGLIGGMIRSGYRSIHELLIGLSQGWAIDNQLQNTPKISPS